MNEQLVFLDAILVFSIFRVATCQDVFPPKFNLISSFSPYKLVCRSHLHVLDFSAPEYFCLGQSYK
jgi:hypothetical protein